MTPTETESLLTCLAIIAGMTFGTLLWSAFFVQFGCFYP